MPRANIPADNVLVRRMRDELLASLADSVADPMRKDTAEGIVRDALVVARHSPSFRALITSTYIPDGSND